MHYYLLIPNSQLIKMMKLTTFLLFAALLHVSASGLAQKISLNEKNAPLEKVFREIRKQIYKETGYGFLYNTQQLQSAPKVDVVITNASLEEALKAVLQNTPFTYTIQDKTIVISPKIQQAPITQGLNPGLTPITPPPIDVHGSVLDEKGQPLVGASIKLKGDNRTVLTDVNGTFVFPNLPDKAVLVISFIGYKPQEVKAAKNLTGIRLELTTASLSEVMVSTGYQTSVKERAPGTIAHVGQAILANRPESDLSAALQGVVAGMQARENADGTVSFTIRGVSTLTNNTSSQGVNTSSQASNQRAPLIVVDGFALSSNDFSTINPNDVESVDVLKDAAASAIWGARSANGVIVITTKKGKGKNGLTINGGVFTRIARRPDLSQTYTVARSADMVTYEKYAFANKIYPTSGTFYQGGLFPTEFNYTLTAAQQLLFGNLYGRVSTAAMNSSLDSLSSIDNRSQIQQYLLQPATTQQYNISLSDNTDRSKTYASLLFENNRDSYIGNGYQRYDINFANEYKLTKFLTFNFNTYIQYKNQSNSGATQNEINGYPNLFGGGLSPYELLVNPDGSYVKQVAGGTTGQGGPDPYILSTLPLSKFPYADWSYNLLREVRGRNFNTKNYFTRIQAGLTIKLMRGLTFSGQIQYERGKSNVNNFYSDDTYYVRNMINTYTAYNNTTKTVGVSLLPKGGIDQTSNTDITNYDYRGKLDYLNDIGRKFSLNATLAGEVSQYRTDGTTNPWLYGYNPATLGSTVPPYGYGSSVNVFTAATVTGGSVSSLSGGNTVLSYGLDRYVSYLAASNLTYDRKYTLTLNIRGDASNYITNISSLRWSPFWSVGGNWDVKAEKFAQKVKWIDYLHVRASYGSNGTADKSTSTQALLSVGTSPNAATGTITASVSSFGNPYLHWERTHVTNLGFDFALFNNKLTGNLNLYNKQSTEVTGTVTLPAAYGTSSQKFNDAAILNRGIEVELGTSFQLPGGFNYSTSANYAYNYNIVNQLYFPNPLNQNVTLYSQNNLNGGINTFIQGKPVNGYYTYNYAGVSSTGIPQVYGLDGVLFPFSSVSLLSLNNGVSAGYMNYAGTTIPPHTMGWRNTITYRGFSLTVQVVGTFGATFLDPSFNYASAFVGYGKTAPNFLASQVLNGSLPPITNDPNLTVWNRYSGFLTNYIESSSYIQLKEVVLNYNVPIGILGKSQIRNINIYVQGRDLGMIWNKNKYHYNPDFLPGTNRPLTTVTFGVKFGL